MNVQTVASQVVHAALCSSYDTGTSDITNPMHWPNSSRFGVEYKLQDRQFPKVWQPVTVVYFDNIGQLVEWLKEKREWIRGTDFDFSMSYSVYVWDWGPMFKYSKLM
jgi:hypothetical protein